jgi:hypothetical protein
VNSAALIRDAALSTPSSLPIAPEVLAAGLRARGYWRRVITVRDDGGYEDEYLTREGCEARSIAPEGYVLPKVTDDMLNAGQERLCQLRSSTNFDDEVQAEVFLAMFRAMLSAAPQPPSSGEGATVTLFETVRSGSTLFEVTQVDREAAAELAPRFYRLCDDSPVLRAIREGRYDNFLLVQAFARHAADLIAVNANKSPPPSDAGEAVARARAEAFEEAALIADAEFRQRTQQYQNPAGKDAMVAFDIAKAIRALSPKAEGGDHADS